MDTLGGYLKNKREAKNISLQDIANITKINISYLEAIENNKFQKLPAPAFVKGFLRQYAQCIGLDPGDVILRFSTATPGETDSPAPPVKKRGLGKESTWIILAGILFLFLVVGLFFRQGSGTRQESKGAVTPHDTPEHEDQRAIIPEKHSADEEAPNSNEVDQGQPATQGEAGPYVNPSESEQVVEPISLTVYALQRTWIRVSADSDPPFEVMLRPGEKVVWKADEKMRLRIGNAGGVKILYNGKVMEGLGKTGEVIEIAFPLPQE